MTYSSFQNCLFIAQFPKLFKIIISGTARPFNNCPYLHHLSGQLCPPKNRDVEGAVPHEGDLIGQPFG